MEKTFSTAWKSSTQPRKQRKYRHNMPYHLRGKMLGSHLSSDLHKQLGKRSLTVRKNDLVKIMRGSFKGKTGKVLRVNTIKATATIEGIDMARRDGTRVAAPINASNLLIIEIHKEDAKRIKNDKKSP